MRSGAVHATPSSPASWRYRHLAVALLITGVVLVILIAFGQPPRPKAAGGIVIIHAPDQASAVSDVPGAASVLPMPVSTPVGASSATSDMSEDPVLAREVSSAFPMLEDVRVRCAGDCVLTSKAYDERDKNYSAMQLPYLGRLEDMLRQRGLDPVDGLMIEEQGGGETMLRVKFTRR